MRNIRKYTLLLLASTLSFIHPASARAESSEGRERVYQSSLPSKIVTEWKSVKIAVTPPNSYWEKVAVCETNSNWKDKGKWAGGLGIYSKGTFGSSSMGTWEHYGGEEFAPSPDKATKEEQITVANRISVLGWKTTVYRDPEWAKRKGVPAVYEYDKKPVGFSGWGCVKSKSTGKWRIGLPKNWKKYGYVKLPSNKQMYCKEWEPLFYKHGLPVKVFSYIAWRESRCLPHVIGFNYHSGQNSSSCVVPDPSCSAVKSYDSGLLQINSSWKTLTSQICNAQYNDLTVLKDPNCNIRVAKYLYQNTSDRLYNWRIKVKS